MRYAYLETGEAFWQAWFMNADNSAEALHLLAERYARYYGIDSSLPPGALFEVSPALASLDRSDTRLISVYKNHIPIKKILNKTS